MNISFEGHDRRSIRLNGYDYTQTGAYFVTICAYRRETLFGKVMNGEMQLSLWGKIMQDEWLKTPKIRPDVELHSFVVMPNHIHGIIVITQDQTSSIPQNSQINGDVVGAQRVAPLPTSTSNKLICPPRSLGSFVAGFKSVVTKRVNYLRETPSEPVWQRNYYETIIRNESMLNNIRQYIEANPANWQGDLENIHPF